MDKLAQINFNALEGVAAPRFTSQKIGFLFSTTAGNLSLLGLIFFSAGVLLMFYLMSGGFMMIMSKADPKRQQQAKGVITDAFTGFLIVFISFWLVQIIGVFFGLQGITDIFGR